MFRSHHTSLKRKSQERKDFRLSAHTISGTSLATGNIVGLFAFAVVLITEMSVAMPTVPVEYPEFRALRAPS